MYGLATFVHTFCSFMVKRSIHKIEKPKCIMIYTLVHLVNPPQGLGLQMQDLREAQQLMSGKHSSFFLLDLLPVH